MSIVFNQELLIRILLMALFIVYAHKILEPFQTILIYGWVYLVVPRGEQYVLSFTSIYLESHGFFRAFKARIMDNCFRDLSRGASYMKLLIMKKLFVVIELKL